MASLYPPHVTETLRLDNEATESFKSYNGELIVRPGTDPSGHLYQLRFPIQNYERHKRRAGTKANGTNKEQ